MDSQNGDRYSLHGISANNYGPGSGHRYIKE